jgi:hypothetical protein
VGSCIEAGLVGGERFAVDSSLPKCLPVIHEKTDLVRAYFADPIASVLEGKR